MRSLTIGDRVVGGDDSVFVIAEAGVNHDGDPDAAHRLVDVAAEVGADAVKFQTFRTDALVSPAASTTPYQRASAAGQHQADMLRALSLPVSVWPELADHARRAGVVFLSSPFDLRSAEMLVQLGVPALKVGSGELTNHGLLGGLAELGVPLLVSTGMADEAEVDAAAEVISGAPGFALFHCVSAYPAPTDEANVRTVRTMRERYGVPIGWSDHTTDDVSAVAAVALGARLLEKHLTLDRGRTGPDHAASLDPSGMASYISAVRLLSAALGDGVKRRMPSEQENAPLVRRSWHAARDLPAGHAIGAEDVVALRPETGVSAAIPVTGRVLRRALQAGDVLASESLA